MNDSVIEERERDAEKAQQEYRDAVTDAVHSLLSEHDVVDVSPPDVDG